jgi:hypothetical protein
MGERPFRGKGIVELERLYQDSHDDAAVLRLIAGELAHRRTQRARGLAERIDERLEELGGTNNLPPTTSTELEGSSQVELDGDEVPGEVSRRDDDEDTGGRGDSASTKQPHGEVDPEDEDLSEQPITGTLPPDPPPRAGPSGNDPAAVLELWTALEVLSPQTYLQPRDLADGDARRVARFDDAHALPWVIGLERSRPNTKLYYQIVLGAIAMDRASTVLLKAFGDKRPERPPTRGYAALAAVTVDRAGRPVAERPIAVSSFGWGYRLAQEGRLSDLKTWPAIERRLAAGLEARLKREKDDEILPLDEATILAAFRWLCDRIGLPEDERIAPFFAIRIYRWYQAKGDPEPMLLFSRRPSARPRPAQCQSSRARFGALSRSRRANTRRRPSGR